MVEGTDSDKHSRYYDTELITAVKALKHSSNERKGSDLNQQH
jgi:hypothetical protein